jgi:hypothetical protein
MKRFFIKSVACISIAFFLAAILPSGFQYTKVRAATKTPQENADLLKAGKCYGYTFWGSDCYNAQRDSEAIKILKNEAKSNDQAAKTLVQLYSGTSNTKPESTTTADIANIMASLASTQSAFNQLDKDYNAAVVEKQTLVDSLADATPEEKIAAQPKIDSLTREIADLKSQRDETEVALKDIKAQRAAVEGQVQDLVDAAHPEDKETDFTISGEPVKGILGWVVGGFNWVLYAICSALAWVLGWVGSAIDKVIDYTKGMGGEEEILTGLKTTWVILRDTFNIFFIFILLYISIQQIWKGSSANAKKMLSSVVISALLINFSFMITSVVIDVGNIFTAAIYDKGETLRPLTNPTNSTKVTVTSEIMNSLKIQSLEGITKPKGSNGAVLAQTSIGLSVLLIFKIILISVALWAFCQMLVLLVARTVALFMLLALSPVGFIGNVIPMMGEHAKKWRDTLASQVLVGPVFAFLLTVVLVLIGQFDFGNVATTLSGTISAEAGGSNTKDMIGLVFNLAIVIGLLIATVRITKKLSGEVGAMISNGIGSIAGLALGGVGGFALRNTLGRGMSALANNDKFQKLTSNTAVGRLALRGVNNVSKSSLDIRNTGAGKTFGVNLGKAGGKDGFQGQAKRSVERSVATAKLLERDPDQVTNKELTDMALAKKKKDHDEAINNHDKAISSAAGQKAKIEQSNQDVVKKLSENQAQLSAGKPNNMAEQVWQREKKRMKEEGRKLQKEREENEKKIKEKEREMLQEAEEKKKKIEKKEQGFTKADLTESDLSSDRMDGFRKEAKTKYQSAYAGSVATSKIAWLAGGAKGRKAAAKKIRDDVVKGKTDQQKLAELAAKVEKERKEKEEAENPKPTTTS